MKKLILLLLAIIMVSCNVQVSDTEDSGAKPVKCANTYEYLFKTDMLDAIVNKDRGKLPLLIQKYQTSNDELISITLDSLKITSGLDICGGFYYSTWKFKNPTTPSYFDDDWYSEDNHCIKRTYLIEVTNVSWDKKTNCVSWSTHWPEKNPFSKD